MTKEKRMWGRMRCCCACAHEKYKLQKHTIVIIHGIGNGILKNAVHKYLKNNHLVKEFHVDVINTGCTVVDLDLN